MKNYPLDIEIMSGLWQIKEDDFSYDNALEECLKILIGDNATKKLKEHFGDYNLVLQASLQEYKAAGLTHKQASVLKAAKMISFCRAKRVQIRSSKDIFQHIKHIGYKDREQFLVVCLNRQNHIIKILYVSSGGLSGTVVDNKILFSSILPVKPNSIVLAHNHPSGNLEPSHADVDLTDKIRQASNLLDIKVLDHLIVAHDKYLSFADEGFI